MRNHLSHGNQTGNQSRAAVVPGRNFVPSDVPENLRARYRSVKSNISNLEEITEHLNSLLPTQLVEPGTRSPRDLAEQCQKSIRPHCAAWSGSRNRYFARSSVDRPENFVERISRKPPTARIYELLCKKLAINLCQCPRTRGLLSSSGSGYHFESG